MKHRQRQGQVVAAPGGPPPPPPLPHCAERSLSSSLPAHCADRNFLATAGHCADRNGGHCPGLATHVRWAIDLPVPFKYVKAFLTLQPNKTVYFIIILFK